MKRAIKVVKILITKNMERINVPTGTGLCKYLGETFNRSQPFIRKALRGKTNHPDALKIREHAMQKIRELTEN